MRAITLTGTALKSASQLGCCTCFKVLLSSLVQDELIPAAAVIEFYQMWSDIPGAADRVLLVEKQSQISAIRVNMIPVFTLICPTLLYSLCAHIYTAIGIICQPLFRVTHSLRKENNLFSYFIIWSG